MNAHSETLYLIDAHSLIFSVFHAIAEMGSPSGLPTNAVFGFTRDMLYLLKEKKPNYLVCAFDMPGPTFRDKIYPQYKAHRAPMPDDLIPQLPEIHRLLAALRIPEVGLEGYEADDVIATVARAGAKRGLEVFVCTSDKDCRQLIDDHTRLFSLRKRQEMGRKELLEDWGITPEQAVDLQALVGDSTDNVPGVPGIGIKTAAALLQEFGTLEGILASIDKISGAKRKENLRAAVETIPLSRQLVRLADDVPIDLDWEGWRPKGIDAPQLLALCQEWGFHRFADDVRALASGASGGRQSSESERKKKSAQRDLFSWDTGDVEPESNGQMPQRQEGSYQVVDSSEKLDLLLQELNKQERVALEFDLRSKGPGQPEIVGCAFSWKSGEGWYVPMGDSDEMLDQLRPVLENPKIAKVGPNLKQALVALQRHGLDLAGAVGDPTVADYLLHAGERSHVLEDLARRWLNREIASAEVQNDQNQLPFESNSTPASIRFGERADVTLQLCNHMDQELTNAPGIRPGVLKKLYDELEVPLIEVLAELEHNGIRLDLPLLRRISDDLAGQLAEIEKEIYTLAGRSFNIASPMQLRKVLFDELKLPRQKKTVTTGDASTAQDTLDRLAALGHALPKKIIEHRQLAKLKGTYVDALPDLVNPETGRVHASFNQTVAATGRLSSSDPNLQNIPIRTEQGRQIRQAFIPEHGWVLLTADYSQIELRLLAHLCGDEELRRAFAEDKDIHALVAAQVFNVPEEEVTPEMRRRAKAVNFGIIYGMSAFGLAERLGITQDEAGKFIEAYFARYPKVMEYQDRLLADCRKNGYVSTILGRKRAITGVRAKSPKKVGGVGRNQPEREAINMEIQGSAADLLKLAMLNIARRLKDNRDAQRSELQARMLLTVHDELVFESPPEELHEVAALVEEEMTSAMKLEVPLKVDISAGANWLDLEEMRAATV